MALDSFGGIKSISVPAWLKLTIFVVAIAVLAADLAVLWSAVRDPNHKDWFSAAFSLLGTLVPLLLAILLLAFSTRGTEAISRRTSRLLLDLVPRTIVSSLTWNLEIGADDRGETSVEVAHRQGDFCCLYRIVFRDPQSSDAAVRELFLLVELKVRQANMHLCVPTEAFDRFCQESGLVGYAAFERAFPNTLNGAQAAGCVVNKAVYQLVLPHASAQTAVVVYRQLSSDFFTDPAEQLYWAQDMVTMLKGLQEEGLDQSKPLKWFRQAASG